VVVDKRPRTYHKGERQYYSKFCEAQRHKSNEAYTWTVYNCPRLSHLTCAILVTLGSGGGRAALVRGAIGLDPSRGDTLEVVTVPVYQPHAVLPVIPWSAQNCLTRRATTVRSPGRHAGHRGDPVAAGAASADVETHRASVQPQQWTTALCDLSHNKTCIWKLPPARGGVLAGKTG